MRILCLTCALMQFIFLMGCSGFSDLSGSSGISGYSRPFTTGIEHTIYDGPANFKVTIVNKSNDKLAIILWDNRGDWYRYGDHKDKNTIELIVDNRSKNITLDGKQIPYFTEGLWICDNGMLTRKDWYCRTSELRETAWRPLMIRGVRSQGSTRSLWKMENAQSVASEIYRRFHT